MKANPAAKLTDLERLCYEIMASALREAGCPRIYADWFATYGVEDAESVLRARGWPLSDDVLALSQTIGGAE